MEKICCPVCGSKLIYHRIDDGEEKIAISLDGEDVDELGSDSNGSTNVICSQDISHKSLLDQA